MAHTLTPRTSRVDPLAGDVESIIAAKQAVFSNKSGTSTDFLESLEADDPFDDFDDDDFDDEFDDDFEEDWEDDLPEDQEFPDTFDKDDEDVEKTARFKGDPDFDK